MNRCIDGFSRYLISDSGIVTNSRTNRVMKPRLNHKGYVKYGLIDDDGVQQTVLCHRLVAIAFIDNVNEYPLIDHINEDKTDNRVENLRWCTNQMNLNYYSFGRCNHINKKYRVYGNREEYIRVKGKSCKVNGQIFHSAGSAAKMIAGREGKVQATISKEIRRMLQGKREPWCMYGRYDIEPI